MSHVPDAMSHYASTCDEIKHMPTGYKVEVSDDEMVYSYSEHGQVHVINSTSFYVVPSNSEFIGMKRCEFYRELQPRHEMKFNITKTQNGYSNHVRSHKKPKHKPLEVRVFSFKIRVDFDARTYSFQGSEELLKPENKIFLSEIICNALPASLHNVHVRSV